jgi:iron-sulfur cluster repair protein YtfE (RIC family)
MKLSNTENANIALNKLKGLNQNLKIAADYREVVEKQIDGVLKSLDLENVSDSSKTLNALNKNSRIVSTYHEVLEKQIKETVKYLKSIGVEVDENE